MTTTSETMSDTRIAALLAQIPDEERTLFQRYYQSRLQQALADAQRGASHLGADPDAVERELLEQLIREAEGRDDPDGLGLVPIGDDEQGQVIPPDTDPRTAPAPGASGQRSSGGSAAGAAGLSRGRMALGAVIALLPVVWLIVSVFQVAGGGATSVTPTAATKSTTPAGTPTPLAELDGGQKALVWHPASLELPEQRQVYRVAASTGALGGSWAPETSAGVAAWLSNTFINTIICLPPSAADLRLSPGQAVQLRNASGALRHYQVVAVQAVERQQVELLDQRRAGLTLIVCGTGGNTRQVISAVYRPELPGATAGASTSATQELPGVGRLQIQAVTTITDTTTAAGQQLVGVTVQVSNTSGLAISLADLAAQLQLEDGTVAEAVPTELGTVPAAAATTATWRYRVPAAGGQATWRAVGLTGQSVRLPLELPAAPEPRIRAALTPDQVRRSGSLLHLALTVEAQGGPTTLTAQDVLLLAGDQALALDPQSTPLPLELSPAQPAQLDLFATLPPSAQVLELRVRAQRWRIRLPKSP